MTQTTEQRNALRRTGRAVVALAASELLGKVATLLTFLFMARLLDVPEFGLLSFGISLGLLLAVLSSLGLDARVVQLGSAHPELLDRCYGALIVMRVVLSTAGLAGTAAVLLLTMPVGDAAIVLLLVASGFLDTLVDASRAACGALQRQELSAVVLVLQRFSALTLTVGALLVTGSPMHAALGFLLGTGVGVVGMALAARRSGARPTIRGSRREALLVLEAAPVMGLVAVVTMAVFRIDATMIAVMLGTAAVGVYSAGYRLFEAILFISWSLSRVYVPLIAARADDADHVRVWSGRALVVVCAVYLPFGAILALRGDDLVGLLFGAEYVEPGMMASLAAAPLLFGVGHLGASVLFAIRPHPVVLIASVAALVVNVTINLWLIPVWGITAAAVATTGAFLVQSVIVMSALARFTGSIAPHRALAPIFLATAGAGLAAGSIDATLPALGASVVTFLLGWAAASRLIDPIGFDTAATMVRRTSKSPGGLRPALPSASNTNSD